MKSLKSILDMELIQVDWKNIININKDKCCEDYNSENEDSNLLFV